jgi:hypothetical protein
MEERNANVIFGKAGGSASKNAYTCKISLPKTWIDRMGVTIDKREVTLAFDGGNQITIVKPEMSGIKHAPLANNRRIRRFALVWAQMYKNHASVPGNYFEDVEFMGEELADLGFEMDAGESLKRAVSGEDAFRDNAVLERVINQIDLQTLGNAIFSQWRYWNHWSMGQMEEPDYQWFVIALSRLAELAQ